MGRRKRRKNKSFEGAQVVSEKEFIINEYMMPAITILVGCLLLFVVSFYIYLNPPLERMGVRGPMGVMIVSTLMGICAIVLLLLGIYKIKRLGRKDGQ